MAEYRGKEETPDEKQELLARSEVSLILDKYDDIFSSFDPRPYSQRALSVDFLAEAKRATREITPGMFELRFMLPYTERRLEKENMIKKRLREHFRKHCDILERDRKKVLKQGWGFVLFGVLFMFFAAYILFNYAGKSLMGEFLVVLMEPGGWFLFWEGLDLLIFESKKINPDLEFYRKMVSAEIIFNHY